MLTSEQLLAAFNPHMGGVVITGGNYLAGLRAVESAVREDMLAELSAGVDVEALADATARRFCQNDRNGGGCPLATETGCSACAIWCEEIEDAIRTAVAQAVARCMEWRDNPMHKREEPKP